MKIVHSSRRERARWLEENDRLGYPIDGRYRNQLIRFRGRPTRRQRQVARMFVCEYGHRSKRHVVIVGGWR